MHTEVKRVSLDLSPETGSPTTRPQPRKRGWTTPSRLRTSRLIIEKKSPDEAGTTRGQRAWHRVGMSVRVLSDFRHSGHIFPHLTSHRNILKESAPRHSTFTPERSAAKSLAGGTTHLQGQPEETNEGGGLPPVATTPCHNQAANTANFNRSSRS